jgi:hypothetical protein
LLNKVFLQESDDWPCFVCDDSFSVYLVIGPRLARRKVGGRRWTDAVTGVVHDLVQLDIAGKEDLSPLKRKIEWESDGTDDDGNQRVKVASLFDGCLRTLVDEVDRIGSKLAGGACHFEFGEDAVQFCIVDRCAPGSRNQQHYIVRSEMPMVCLDSMCRILRFSNGEVPEEQAQENSSIILFPFRRGFSWLIVVEGDRGVQSAALEHSQGSGSADDSDGVGVSLCRSIAVRGVRGSKNARARPAAGFVTQGTARALLSWGLGLTRIVTSSRSV